MKDKTLQEYTHILREDFAAFVQRTFRELNPNEEFLFNWHIELIASKLEQVRKGEIKRLIINLPPRQGKSIICSVAFPAFFLGHKPSAKILCISYGQDLASDLAEQSRTLMQSAFYQSVFETRLSDVRQSVEEFKTTSGGKRLSASLIGGLTGRGADLIVIDDPIKTEDVDSDLKRAAANTSFYKTVYSRLNNKETGAIIIIMQRLHIDDFVAFVTEREAWDVVTLPAIADVEETFDIPTPYGIRHVARREGEALHPARESAELLQTMRRSMGDYVFSAQYQQNPLPREGGIVKPEWLQYYREPPESFDRILQSWDTASKEGEGNSYNVCTTWGLIGGHFYLLHRYRERVPFDRLSSDAINLAHRFKPSTIIVEAQSTGVALISELRRNTNYHVEEAPASPQSKTARLEAKIDRFSGGLVHLPKDASWLDDYVSELTHFPATRHSDQVDSTVQALGAISPGVDGSFERAIEFMRLQSLDPDEEIVRIKIPDGCGTLIDMKGHIVRTDRDGIAAVDRRSAAAFMRAHPKIERLDP